MGSNCRLEPDSGTINIKQHKHVIHIDILIIFFYPAPNLQLSFFLLNMTGIRVFRIRKTHLDFITGLFPDPGKYTATEYPEESLAAFKRLIGDYPTGILMVNDNMTLTQTICFSPLVHLDYLEIAALTPEPLTCTNSYQMTALHYLCHNSAINPVTLEYLLSNGADPNIPNQNGHTPLHLLIDNQCHTFTMFEIMFRYNADPNYHVDGKDTCFGSLLRSKCNELRVYELFVNHGALSDINGSSGDTPLHVALDWIDITPEIFFEVMRGCDSVYQVNNRFQSALHIICMNLDLYTNIGKNALAEILNRKQDINMLDCHGNTPLHYLALKSNNTDIIDILINHGADI